MKFTDIPYERPDVVCIQKQLEDVIEQLKDASNYEAARAAFIEKDKIDRYLTTVERVAGIRHDIDTCDEYYEKEVKFWSSAKPQIQVYNQKWIQTFLKTPFRAEFVEEFGELIFLKEEISLKTFSPEIMEDMVKEGALLTEYRKLIASSQIHLDGKTYTITQMAPLKDDPDNEKRLAAWKAEGCWFKEQEEKLDDIYDQLVHLRDGIAHKLGFEKFTPLGYYRLGRNCYTEVEVEKFRNAVVKYVVPVVEKIYKAQAERIGKAYPMSFADAALEFRDGNPKPVGTSDEIVNNGKTFYDALSPVTGEFFRKMTDGQYMDLIAKPGKTNMGYCGMLPVYGMPFIFANFNGTQYDVKVITHEAGHAFQIYTNIDRIPQSLIFPGLEAAEVHSMSMEFFGDIWADLFFGEGAKKYLYSHLAGALSTIPYGAMVDHFQHVIYEKPEMTPRERHNVWKELLASYMPWLKIDGEIPYYSDGEGWQRQQHIYNYPFYYIDYCLAQTVALQFWSLIQEDKELAWEKYMRYTKLGGSKTFTELLTEADLEDPFDENCLKNVCEKAEKWLSQFKW